MADTLGSEDENPGRINDEQGNTESYHNGSTTGETTNITLIGAGTIGLSFAALHLTANPSAHITIHDPRPDLTHHINTNLPTYLSSLNIPLSSLTPRLHVATTLATAVSAAHIIQECGPENLPFKSSLWPTIETTASPSALLWSSTSGIPASAQSVHMARPERLLVVHPYNPPHIMPLLEIVPSPSTAPDVVDRTVAYWRAVGRAPVVLKQECAGFVANRLAFALLREAVSLVHDGVVGVAELDAIVTSSMGPRWAVQGPFQSYHAGGGEGGLEGFWANIGGTVRECWRAGEEVRVGGEGVEGRRGWEEGVFREVEAAYGRVDVGRLGRVTGEVIRVVEEEMAGAERSGSGSKAAEGGTDQS